MPWARTKTRKGATTSSSASKRMRMGSKQQQYEFGSHRLRKKDSVASIVEHNRKQRGYEQSGLRYYGDNTDTRNHATPSGKFSIENLFPRLPAVVDPTEGIATIGTKTNVAKIVLPRIGPIKRDITIPS
jgi:hypothetical protein